MNNSRFSERRLKKMTVLVGAFIAAVRKTGKTPTVATLYKETFGKRCDANFARKFKAVMEQTVAHIDGKSARLYRDNRTPDDIMPLVEERWFHTNVPEPIRKITRKPKVTMCDLKYDEKSEEFYPEEKPVSEDLLFMPEQKDSPIAPEGKVYDCKSELVEEKPILKSLEDILSDIELSIKMLDAHGFYLIVDGSKITICKDICKHN